jgi:hypothetical protein
MLLVCHESSCYQSAEHIARYQVQEKLRRLQLDLGHHSGPRDGAVHRF